MVMCKDIRYQGPFLGEKFQGSYTFIDGQGKEYPLPTHEYAEWYMQCEHFQLAIAPAWFVIQVNGYIGIRLDPSQTGRITVDWLETNFPGFRYELI